MNSDTEKTDPDNSTVLPGDDGLHAGLVQLLKQQGLLTNRLEICDRSENIYTSTFPSEIVSCCLDGRPANRFFLKHSVDRGHWAYGHRGGVEYESQIYLQLLNRLDISTARAYGVCTSPTDQSRWLVLDCLEDCSRVNLSLDPEAMPKAARWIGRYHALCSECVSDPELSFVTRYDTAYYRGWVKRAERLVEEAGYGSRWFTQVCNRIDEVFEILLDAPQTIIHGEYYPKNILLQKGSIYPVDWESTAIGCGETDLATLAENWPLDVVRELERMYRRSRWPDGAPSEFNQHLNAARIYVQFRWLGDRQARLPAWSGYLDALQGYAKELGLI